MAYNDGCGLTKQTQGRAHGPKPPQRCSSSLLKLWAPCTRVTLAKASQNFNPACCRIFLHGPQSRSLYIFTSYVLRITLQGNLAVARMHKTFEGLNGAVWQSQDWPNTCEARQDPHLYAERPHCSGVCLKDSLIGMHAMPQVHPGVRQACMPTQDVDHCSAVQLYIHAT